jgi:hypothetical protein
MGGMSLNDAGVDPTRTLCSSGEENTGTDSINVAGDINQPVSRVRTKATTMTVEPQAAALLAHVVSQMQQNVDFLVSQNYISSSDASVIKAKLPNPTLDTPRERGPPVRRTIPQPPARAPLQAQALWAYNLNGEVCIISGLLVAAIEFTRIQQEPEDLSFAAGDIIEIVAETNDDWWMGKAHGVQALFPASYVEKIDSSKIDSSKIDSSNSDKPMQKFRTPPPYSTNMPPANGVDTGLQPAPGQEEKKKGFSKYKSTVCIINAFPFCLKLKSKYSWLTLRLEVSDLAPVLQ